MTTLWADLETFSTRDIMNGPHQYAEDCEVLLFGYAIDDGPAKVWDVTTGERMPFELAWCPCRRANECSGRQYRLAQRS